MQEKIAVCGLDCEKCDAYVATKTNDDALREKVAREWSAMNHVTITPGMINCDGCRANGRKTPYCASLCPVRQCALGKGVETCADCEAIATCETIAPILGYSEEAKKNLLG